MILLIAGILFWSLLPMLNSAREKKNRGLCANNLRQIGIAMLAYASDHDGYFPTSADNAGDRTNAYWFTALLKGRYCGESVFRCPSDVVSRNTPGRPRSYAIRADDNFRSYNPGAVFWIQGSRTNCPLLRASETILVGEKVDPMSTLEPFSWVEAIKSPAASQEAVRPRAVHVPGAPFVGNYLFMDGRVAWIETVDPRQWPNCPTNYSAAHQPCP